MTTLSQLLEQKATLEKQIEITVKQERSGAVAQVKTLMEQHGLTIADLGLKKASAAKGGSVAAKYRNPSTGEAWSGRGMQPRWLRSALQSGGSLEDFAL
jgi:DNA-binding protein H-NS